MNREIDNYLKIALRCWAIRQQPPKSLRNRLINQANLFKLAAISAESLPTCTPTHPEKVKFALDLGEWLKLLGTYPPTYMYPIRIGPPLRMLG